MITRAKVPPKTRGERIAEGQARWDAVHAMEQQRLADQAAWQQEHDAFARRVQAARAGHAAATHRLSMAVEDGRMTPEQADAIRVQANEEAFAAARATIKPLDAIFAEDTARRVAEAEAAEAARIAALTPREIWWSTLKAPDKDYITRWEQVNKPQRWPYAPV